MADKLIPLPELQKVLCACSERCRVLENDLAADAAEHVKLMARVGESRELLVWLAARIQEWIDRGLTLDDDSADFWKPDDWTPDEPNGGSVA